MDAFSSPDLVNWTKHPRVLDKANVSWARRAMWAPSVIKANGKYYIFFGANDVHKGEVGGIGLAVSDKPEGPIGCHQETAHRRHCQRRTTYRPECVPR